MIKTTPNRLFALIKENVESHFENEPGVYDEKPFLWVYEYGDELEAETCEDDEGPIDGMYDYDELLDVDEKTGLLYPSDEKMWAIVDEWFPEKHQEVIDYEYPDTIDEDVLMELCQHLRDAIADGDMRGAPIINVRYATKDGMFNVAPLGDYFFYDGGLFVFDILPQWEKYHAEFAVMGFFGHLCPNRGYAHRVAYCGIQTPYDDYLGHPIFTGDVCYVRDLPECNQSGWREGTYHVMIANRWQGYGFALDNHMLFADRCRHPLQRVGTIFYQLSFNRIKHAWGSSGDFSTMFGPSEYISAYLKMSKLTPCFEQEYLAYQIMSVLTEEFDWSRIFERKDSNPPEPEKMDDNPPTLYMTLDDINNGPDDEPSRITPANISNLEEKEVFVFGSNIRGQHGGGAARFAYKHFGAEWGVGKGMTGQCYALPTMEGDRSFRLAVEDFLQCAREHPQLTFLVTEVGCGIAGYTPEQVAPWFAPAVDIYNVHLPDSFWGVLRKLDNFQI